MSPFHRRSGFGTAVSVLGQGMGSDFDVEALLGQDVIGLPRTYFDDNASWTLGDWAEYLGDNSAPSSTISNLSYDETGAPDIVEFTFDLSARGNCSPGNSTWSYRPTQDAPWPPALEPLRVVA